GRVAALRLRRNFDAGLRTRLPPRQNHQQRPYEPRDDLHAFGETAFRGPVVRQIDDAAAVALRMQDHQTETVAGDGTRRAVGTRLPAGVVADLHREYLRRLHVQGSGRGADARPDQVRAIVECRHVRFELLDIETIARRPRHELFRTHHARQRRRGLGNAVN